MRRRRARGTGSVLQRKGYRTWDLRYTDLTGVRHSKGSFCSRQEAQQALNELLLLAGKAETAPSDAGPTIARLFRLIDYDRLMNKPKSLVELRRRWRLHLEPVFAHLPADKLTTEHLRVYTRDRKAEKARNSTVNRELAILKRMYYLALAEGGVKKVPVFPMLSEAGNVRQGFLEDASYERMAQATAQVGLWLRTMFEIGVTFGWRRTEVLTLTVQQIDWEERTVNLYTSKNGRPRKVPILPGSKVEALLREACIGKAPTDALLTRVDKQGRHYPVRDFRDGWKAATKAAGVPQLTFHDLRRTAVRNLVRAGVPEKICMDITGHLTRAVFERYNIVDQKDVRRAMAALEADRREKLRLCEGSVAPEEPSAAKAKVN
ncbi:MAG TPA: site-specific integrase [Terriglobales bacterium]|nr:site-specific integrase [Terriglobales bacterium]